MRFKFLLIVILFISVYYLLSTTIFAANCPASDYDCQLAEIQREIDALKPAHETNKKELANLNSQLESLKRRIAALSKELQAVEEEIAEREEELAYAREIFNEKTNNYYKFIRIYDPFLPFLANKEASKAFKEIVLRQRAVDGDRQTMEELANDLLKLKNDKETLAKNKENLASVQKNIDERAKFLGGEVAKVENYLSSLTAKQEELLALKAGGFQTSIGDTPPTFEPCSGPPGSANFCDPGFRPAFAAFSFGAPHRKGMSQYGARGRALSGQSHEDILKAYYGNIRIEARGDLPASIKTSAGTLPLEDNYLLGIAEMPSDWDIKALKAQAIAARSYALSYVGYRLGNPAAATGSICITEACQVYKSSKASNPPPLWRQAVNETRGQIVVSNSTNEIISTWYASTAGGYTFSYITLGHTTPGGWDAEGGQSGWPEAAWDKKGGSPWFYKGWFKTRSGASCGRSHPWLKSEELADILNAWSVLYRGGGDTSRISPIDTNCWGGNPYSQSELLALGGFTAVNSVSVVYSNDGYTQSLNFSTNKGSVTIPGEEFKKAFNLRAPGYIGLKSSLFNIEKL